MQLEQAGRGEFQGKRVLVTGGTKGIGAAVVKRLAVGGASVLTTARSVSANASSNQFIQADVSTRDGCERVVKATLDRLGGLDILVNSVGGSTTPSGGALVLTDDHWQQTLDLNLLSAVRLDRGFLPTMLNQGSGVIIHVSSIQRSLPLHEATLAYAAAKAALSNYSKGLSKEMSPRGIRVNSVAPGYTETEAAVALVRALGRPGGNRYHGRTSKPDGLAWRHPTGPSRATRRSCRTYRFPGVRPGVCHHRERVRHRWRNDPDSLIKAGDCAASARLRRSKREKWNRARTSLRAGASV